MLEQLDVLGYFWALVSNFISPFVNFIISFLPDGDPQVYAIIDSVGDVGANLTFNVFYFCDWAAVLLCFGVMVTVALVVMVYNLVMKGINLAAKTVEAIPVVE